VVTPRDQVRDSIIERNRYSPVSHAKAHRGNDPNWTGTFQATIKHEDDLVVLGGVANGKSTGTPGS